MKKTIGKSPLSAYLSDSKEVKKGETSQASIVKKEAKKTNSVKKSVAAPQAVESKQEETSPKTRVTIHVPVDLIERVKNAVYWEPGLTVAGFCEKALSKAIDKLEKDNGKAYPERSQQLKGGRPIK